MDRGDGGGRGRDNTRNESGLERDEYDVTARDSLECVYARGVDRGTRRIFLCVVSMLVCMGVRR